MSRGGGITRVNIRTYGSCGESEKNWNFKDSMECVLERGIKTIPKAVDGGSGERR